ncbi:type I-F CRISPR-associated endoribonuclease Cas6/Csy4 [Pigmentibacter sp. JX0631]|uniref:type I-F CRISPR-associated endoribonuclease Cas6/Csy4 n=1 Tax=Pigmentibacter sp. JX0631 TaxID=2976982 RepID=UPI0024690656|nr:type I-F CRISPR-associated endoribonuclease Cas6/Csy4 [Pigmentibacter sp. JX0631]WGL59728.1 type I-F CRISPR-associated endoribonuclease Cas6/Csy4 [Pigmentibacter sp. JX0631]
MTDFYVNIEITENLEFSSQVILNTLYTKLHIELVNLKSNIGVSFPNYKKTLGNCLRIHGNEKDLMQLMENKWYGNLHSYINVSKILKIPENVSYRIVSRVQSKSSLDRLYRRSLRNGKKTLEEVQTLLSNNLEDKLLKYPFIELKSYSTKQRFKLFIQHQEIKKVPTEGKFSCYGLSQFGTVPWF